MDIGGIGRCCRGYGAQMMPDPSRFGQGQDNIVAGNDIPRNGLDPGGVFGDAIIAHAKLATGSCLTKDEMKHYKVWDVPPGIKKLKVKECAPGKTGRIGTFPSIYLDQPPAEILKSLAAPAAFFAVLGALGFRKTAVVLAVGFGLGALAFRANPLDVGIKTGARALGFKVGGALF